MSQTTRQTERKYPWELFIMGFILTVLFVLPVIFTRVNGYISWMHVLKIWLDQVLLVPLFFINHWLLVPRLLLQKKKAGYLFVVLGLVLSFSFGYKFVESQLFDVKSNREHRPANKPAPIPPYAELLMYSLLVVGVDSGLLLSRRWYENEENKHLLETRNAEMQLDLLRHQVSPHFFMNTLNNIYALIDCDTPKAKEAVMKLSKLMRYMLYENEKGKVKVGKEFEFIRSYIDLMKLRFSGEVSIILKLPEGMDDLVIPPMLFICYIENAFKHGVSYQHESFIHIFFERMDDRLRFTVINSRQSDPVKPAPGGLGLANNENRLKLLYGNAYKLDISSTEALHQVHLEIPLP